MSVTMPERSESVAAVLPVGAAIASVGISLPEAVVPNAEIAPRIGVTDDWIVRRTGIRTRRVAAPDERLVTHASNAAMDALKRAAFAPEQLDLVLVATTTPDEVMPNAAPQVAHELGATHAGAFDDGVTCSANV
jgi:3-oxoacyl-[acyl-carrier-protein] synthase-3